MSNRISGASFQLLSGFLTTSIPDTIDSLIHSPRDEMDIGLESRQTEVLTGLQFNNRKSYFRMTMDISDLKAREVNKSIQNLCPLFIY